MGFNRDQGPMWYMLEDKGIVVKMKFEWMSGSHRRKSFDAFKVNVKLKGINLHKRNKMWNFFPYTFMLNTNKVVFIPTKPLRSV